LESLIQFIRKQYLRLSGATRN